MMQVEEQKDSICLLIHVMVMVFRNENTVCNKIISERIPHVSSQVYNLLFKSNKYRLIGMDRNTVSFILPSISFSPLCFSRIMDELKKTSVVK